MKAETRLEPQIYTILKTVWIQIIWLLLQSDDPDPHCFSSTMYIRNNTWNHATEIPGNHYYKCTTKTLIRTTIKNSIGFTPLALNNFRCFSSNSMKFAVVIENAMGYSFLCKSLIRQFHRCLVGRKKQNVTFSKFHPNIHVYFSLISKDQKHEMCLRNTFLTFQYSLEPVCY